MSQRHSTLSRAVACVFLLVLFGFRGDLITRVTAQRADRSAKEAALKALNVDDRFEPLSGAPRNPLELRRGRQGADVAAAGQEALGQHAAPPRSPAFHPPHSSIQS